jgi:cyclopropane fatty-acyl-phospholipid synthase-like methyltransferase
VEFEKPEDFYSVYDQHRTYVRAEVRPKHIRNFDDQFWKPADVTADMSVLELGCGTGLFLAYLKAKGIDDFQGVDADAKVRDFMPEDIAGRVIIGDIWQTIAELERKFDRIVLFDVFEHFSNAEGVRLLGLLRQILKPGGRVVMRVPNAASPWGLQYQFNDLTHKAMYGPGSLSHAALAAGYETIARLSVRRGSPLRRFAERTLESLLNRLLTEPPPLWGANMVAVLRPKE